MTTSQSSKSTFFLATGCLLVISIVGVTMFESTNFARQNEQLSDFNERLVALNQEIHQADASKEPHEHLELESVNVDSGVNRAQIATSSAETVTMQKPRSNHIKPFVGKFETKREDPAFDWLDPKVSINAIVEASRTREYDETMYGWIQLRSDVKASELRNLTKKLGVKVVSSSPKYVRVKLPVDRDLLTQLADIPEVEGFGLMSNASKTPAHLSQAFDFQSYGTEVPVFITTMDDDIDQSMKQRLIAMGVTVGQWQRDIRTYSANLDQMTLQDVLSADFVEKVSPNSILQAHLAHSTGAVGADLHRTFTEAGHIWTERAGGGATIGVMDTGINTLHQEFSDKSICTRSTDYTSNQGEADAKVDPNGHGSHVSGIAAASGITDPASAGVAPGSKSMRVGKVLTNSGGGDTLMYFNGVDFFTETDPCDDPATADPPRVINVSLGGFTPEIDGTSIISRKMDAASYNFRQNYVISAGNDGTLGPGDTSATKSAISVGMATDSGVIHTWSSHGPTADGRLLPQIVAPGFQVVSVDGGGNKAGYWSASGTSMSAPVVTGLGGVLIGENPELADNPAAVRASLLAAAIKPRRWIGSKENIPQSNTDGPGDIQHEYGLGFASLVPHDLDGVDHGLVEGEITSDSMSSTVITVPEGTARLDIVLAFNEPMSPALNKAVMSNIDLYLDKDGNCGGAACGEYSSKSEIDTVEWILIKDPAPGTYELKVVPANAFDMPVLFGAAWVMIDDDVPELSITSETNAVLLDKGDRLNVDLNVGASGFVASGVTVHVMCRANPIPAEEEGEEDENPCDAYAGSGVGWLPGSSSTRGDGTVTDMALNNFSAPIPVGAVTAASSKDLTLRLSGSTIGEVGSHTLYFVATSWNGMSDHHVVNVFVDGDTDVPVRAVSPANDNIDNAIALTGETGVLQPDLILATREGGEPMLRDAFLLAIIKFPISSEDNLNYADSVDLEYVRTNSVWYKVTAPNKPILLAFGNIPENVGLNVYKGNAARSALVADNWVGATETSAEPNMSINLEPDTPYYIQVYAHFDVGELDIAWRTGEPEPPPNDHFAAAKPIEGDIGRVNGTNFRASLEGFETYDSTYVFSTWYSWSPDSDGAFRFELDGDARVAVLSGSKPADLRRISTVPDNADHIYVHATKQESYRIVVVSQASQNTLSGYWLAWGKVEDVKDHASNDMFAMAEEAVDTIFDDWETGRTVEPGEPRGSGIGSRWWKWTAPASGGFTFTSNGVAGDMASVFSGSSLSNLQLLGNGHEFVVNIDEGTEYYISIGRSLNTMYVDYLATNIPPSIVTWGPTPANDDRSNAITLAGSTGTNGFTHAFATKEENDGLKPTLSRSLWWEWTATESGWVQFATPSNPTLPWRFRETDSLIFLYDGNTGRLIGTSDRSYLLNGNSEITFYAESGKSYPIQTALRAAGSTNPTGETSLSWGPVDAPIYSRFVGQYRDAARNPDVEIAALENPTGIATNEGGGKIFVNAASGLLVFDAIDVDTMPIMSNEVAYVGATGAPVEGVNDALLYWDTTINALYAIGAETVWLANEYDTPDGHFAECVATGSDYGSITDALTTHDGNFLYILGQRSNPGLGYEISIFSRSDESPCELSLVQSVNRDSIAGLRTTFSFAASPDSSHVYLASDDGVVTLARDAATGELTEIGTASVFDRAGFFTWWRESEAVLAPLTKDHLFITSEDSPTVAVYSLTDPTNPELIDSLAGYYIGINPSFTPEPGRITYRYGCRLIGSHATSIAVDFMCRGELLTAELQESGDLWIMDAIHADLTDRYGRSLMDVPFAPDGLKKVGARPLSQNLFILNLGVVDSFVAFDHTIQIEGNPND